jgi:pimeloyl-ACP methyl ester carboxylesterase
MELDQKSIKEAYPTINGKILLMVHGSCLGDFQWTRKGHNHGEKLAEEFNKTPIYLNYNSGLHVSTNGQRFSELLEELVNNWPVPVEEIIIVSHSMGGLVARSAFYYGNKGQKTWTKYLKKVVFMGTPHHGSQLERTGNYVDVILNSIHYTKPFARLGKIRSAGVTDLRYGNLIDEDWNGNDRFERTGDQRASLPLPEEVDFYSIAAVTGKKIKSKSNRILGDGLVNIKSALGEHVNPAKNLHLKKASKLIVYETAHIDLLSSLTVYAKLKEWLI